MEFILIVYGHRNKSELKKENDCSPFFYKKNNPTYERRVIYTKINCNYFLLKAFTLNTQSATLLICCLRCNPFKFE